MRTPRIQFSSLRFRLFFLVLLAVIPASAFMWFAASRDRAAAADAAEAEALRVVRRAARDQAVLLEQARQILVALAQAPSLRSGPTLACSVVFNDLRAQYLQAYPRYANLGVIAPDGSITCSVEPVSGPVNVADRPYFQRALSTLDFTLGEAAIDPALNQAFLNVVYPVLDFGGEVRLMLFATLDLSWLNAVASEAELPAGSTLSVLDPAGLILARYPEPERWVGQTFAVETLPEDVDVGRSEGTLEITGVDGVRRLFAYTPLNPDADAGNRLSVNVGIPVNVVYAQADRTLANNLLVLGLMVGAALLFTFLGGEFFVVRPVARLLRATGRLAAGDLKARTGLAPGGQRGELGQLARAFDQMAAALEQREQSLRESERRYRTLAQNFPNGAVLLFDHDLRYTLADGTGLADVGLSSAMLEGRTIYEVFPPEVWTLLEPPFRATLAGAASEFEVPFAGRVYLLHSLPVRDEHGVITAGLATTQDITARQQAAQTLREREAQYRSIFESVNDGLFILDLDGRIVEGNPAAARLSGYAPEALGQLGYGDLIHTDHQAIVEAFLQSVRDGGEFRGLALTLRRDGLPFLTEMLGTPIVYRGRPHALAVVRDVTEQVQAQQLLEQRVDERTRQLTTLLQVARNVTAMLELEPLLGLILDQLREVMEYSGATIFTLQDDELSILDYRGPITAEQARHLRFSLSRAAANREVIQRRAPVIIDDVRSNAPLALAFQAAAGAQIDTTYAYIRCWMGVPLMIKERVIGMLSLDHSQPGYYTEQQAHLALAIASQAAIAIENARLYEQAGQLAALEERQKLARELHDSVSQALYGIALGARTARTLLDRGASTPAVLADPLDYVLSLAEAGLAEMRALIFELRPESLKTEGLVVALNKQIDSLRMRHRLEVQAALGNEPDLPLDLKEALYRIAQEAMHNIAKHARARRVRVELGAAGPAAVLTITDDGVGFDTHGDFPGHFGLRSMRERAERLGGAFTLDSAPGQGTRLSVRLPSSLSQIEPAHL